MADDLPDALAAVGKHLDLTDYEIDAYVTVLDHGQLTAAEIADRTDIPQPRVYDTVRSLDDRGLVELRESRPMQVLALDPEDALESVQTSLSDLVETLEARYTTPTREAEAVSLMKSRQTIVRHVEGVIEAAEYELVLSLTPALLDSLAATLAERREAGVTIELLVTPASDAPSPEAFDYEAVANTVRARRGLATPVIAVADGDYSVYATQDALRWDADRYGVVFNRSALGFLVSGFFSMFLWTTAEPIVETDSDGRFPRRYASIRRCISDLAGREGTFYATVAGREVETGSRRTVAGRVLDVSLAEHQLTATLTIEGESGPVEIGGQVAALEDIEAHEIRVGRDGPPDLD